MKTCVAMTLLVVTLVCHANAEEVWSPDWSPHMWTYNLPPSQQPENLGPVLGICLALTVVIGAGCFIHACQPGAHCVGNGVTNWCTYASRRTLAADVDLHVSATNYANMKICQACCGISDRTGTTGYMGEGPLYKITVSASADAGRTWNIAGSDVGPLNGWQVHHADAPETTCLYYAVAEPYSE